jgi:transposase
MASKAIHRKKNGAAYVYAVESYWDKDKKAPRNRQVCLGRLDEESGNIIPSGRKRRTNQTEPQDRNLTARIHGPFLLLKRLADELKLSEIIQKSFPEFWEEIMSLVFFLVEKGLPLSRCEMWSESHSHPYGRPISSQRVSEILQKITEDDRLRFLSLWLDRLSEEDVFCYDITSVSSYGNNNAWLYWGYNRDHEKLPQINLAMLFGQESGLPAYYRRLPGNINDVSTLKTTTDSLAFLGCTKLQFVLDQGFYSEKNVETLLEKRHRFVLMVPSGRVWVRNILDQHLTSVTSPANYAETSEGETLYMVSHPHKMNNRRCFLHIFYNAARAAADYDALTKKLVLCKKELETGRKSSAHEDFYEQFFFVSNTPKRGVSVQYNDEAIQKYRNRYAGFFCILTNMKMESQTLLDIYRRKDVVENCFDDLKNSLDMKRLRIHSAEAMDNRLLLQFIAVILVSKIRMIAKSHEKLKSLSMREVLEALESVVQISSPLHNDATLSESGPLQRSIYEAFAVPPT